MGVCECNANVHPQNTLHSTRPSTLHCKLYSHGLVEETYLVFDTGGRLNLAAPLPPLTAGNTFTPSLYEVTFQPIAIDVQGPLHRVAGQGWGRLD